MKIIKAQHLEGGRDLHWKIPEQLENVEVTVGDLALVDTVQGEQIVKITAVFFSKTDEIQLKKSGRKFTVTKSVIDIKSAPEN